MSTGRANRHHADIKVDMNAIRPAFDSMNPVEVDLEATPAIVDDTLVLRNAVRAQRARSAMFAAGAAAFLALLVAGGAEAVAKSETARALDRVHAHVAAANAVSAPPPAVIEILPAIMETETPVLDSNAKVAAIPANGGTPAAVIVGPHAAKKRVRK